jgi:hypothetical protein
MNDPALWEVAREHGADLLRDAQSNRLARVARGERPSILDRLRRRLSSRPVSEAPAERLPVARSSGA